MKKIYTLANCSTSQGIIAQMGKKSSKYELQNIKEEKITPSQLDEMKDMAGSYEALFSRRALKYKSLGLAEKKLTEKDYRKFILEEYTFLKRPVIISDKKIFVGNAPKMVQEMLGSI
ncbi:MAG: ArsC/Spx/MgsR family protein [Flavobacteriales bacterium]|nr:ArsC/Spx/MgsR family protein [Flavobacteriales bacterium]